METLLGEIQQTELAGYFRRARWGYAAVSGLHIAGIAMLFGASLPLALRLLGVAKTIPLGMASRLLSPIAAIGAALAVATGIILFSVRATEYASLTVFQVKLGVVATGLAAAILAHARHGLFLDRNSDSAIRSPSPFHGAISIACWVTAIACGRLIAFAGG